MIPEPSTTPAAPDLAADLVAAALGLRSPAAAGVPEPVWDRALHGPASDILARPGKAFRARLVEAGWALAHGAPGALPPALPHAVELLHAGSLVVDDVEDGSTTRRGGSALHVLHGVPVAINTGSWLYFRALELLAAAPLAPEVALAALRAAARTLADCHRGQALDLTARVVDLDRAAVPAVVAATTRLKSGRLMGFSARLGALAAGAPPALAAAADRLGESLGVALQMLDDLGAVAAPARRDKGREDLLAARPTWPWAWLAESADDVTWARLQRRARLAAHPDTPPGELDALAAVLASEVAAVGRARVRAGLAAALEALVAPGLPAVDPAALAHLRAEVARLETSYG